MNEIVLAVVGAAAVAAVLARPGVSASWPRILHFTAVAVVLAAVANTTIQSHSGEDPAPWTIGLWLLLLAAPALAALAFAPPGPLRSIAAVLALLSWAGFLVQGDLTRTDGGFALVVPLGLGLPLLVILLASGLLAWQRWKLARSDQPRTSAPPR